MKELLEITAFGLAAFLAAIGVVFFVALVLHWGKGRDQGLMPYIFYPMTLLTALKIVLSGRNLDLSTEFYDPISEVNIYLSTELIVQHPLFVWASRATSLFVLFAAGERIARRFLYSGNKPDDMPIMLISALWLYFLTNIVSSSFLGTHTSFSHVYLYSILVGSGALLVTQQEGDTVIRSARNSIFIYIVLSAIMLAFRPEMVIATNYNQGLIPGFNLRYSGLESSANDFGPLIVVFLVCLWSRRYSINWVNLFGWAIGGGSLVLTQSKTSWVIFVVCVLCISYFRYGDSLRKRILDYRHPQYAAVLVLMMMLSTSVLGFVVMFTEVGQAINSFLSTGKGGSLLTLTGRAQIWAIAIEEWHNNPLFGYGLTIWDEDYRLHIGLPHAVHAHSQFHQSLSSAGIVGVAGLAIYVMTLFRFTLITAKTSGGLSMAIFMMLFLRSISEVPLAIESLGSEVTVHLLLLMVIASHLAPKSVRNIGTRSPLTPHKFVSHRGLA